MKQYKNLFAMLVIALATGLSLTACGEDDYDTNQYVGDVSLNVYGPSPVMRGGTLRFLGSNLDQIAQVEIPGVAPITSIEVVKAGIPSEIRVIVPHDGPEVGLVKLTSKNGKEIYTKTDLQYTEGLDPANISMPSSAMPGETIRLTVSESGDDYLDMIHMVEFVDGVQVGEDAFTAHTRYLIELVVPETAKTGKLNLYTADLTSSEVDANNVEYQIITTENAIEIGVPSTSKIASPRGEAAAQGTVTAKAGETITLTGNYYNLVETIVFGDVKVTDFKAEKTTLTFALPAEAPDGAFNFITRSGVEVPVGTLNTVKPTEAVATPQPVKAGAALTITGKDLDVVTSVEFPNADAQSGDAITVAADNIVVAAVPETATEGNITLRMANGAGVDVAYTLVKPTVTSYDNSTVSAGGKLTINGTDLDLIKSVQFGEGTTDLKVEPAADGKSIALEVPMDALTGKPTLKLANGTSIEGLDLTINEALFCYAIELPGEEDEVKAGNTMTLIVANSDKLTGVEINGTACQWILAGDGKNQLIIGIPDSAAKGSKVRLISSNGEITYIIDVTPNTEVTTVLWTGMADLAGWSWNWQIGDGTQGASNPRMFVDMDLQEGDIIRLYATAYNDWWQVQFFDGHWGGQAEIGNATGLDNGNNINSGIYNLEEHNGAIEIPVTATLLEQLTTFNDWGYCWILQGEGVTITKIAVTHINVLEQTLWSGDLDFNGWGINWQVGDGTAGASNPNMFVEAGLKAGMTLRLYVTAYNDWWQVQFFNGHWEGQAEIGNATGLNNGNNINAGIYNLDEHNGAIEIPVTATLAEQLTTLNDWGYCWILQGEGCRATKITIE